VRVGPNRVEEEPEPGEPIVHEVDPSVHVVDPKKEP
jgi:formate dehydrogenase iron-sulfur subunit